MTRFFLRIYDFLKRRPWLSPMLAICCALAALCLAKGLRYGEDISEFLPASPQTQRYSEVYNALSEKNNIILLFRSADPYAIEDAVDVFAQAWERLDTAKLVTDTQFFADESKAFALMDFLRGNIPYFLKEEDYARADSILSSPEARRQALSQAHSALLFPSGQMTAESVSRDPMGLFSPVLMRLRDIGAGNGYKLSNGIIYTPDGIGLAFMTSPYGMSETGQNAKIAELIDKAVAETNAQVADVEVSAVGGPLIAVGNASQIKKDSILAVSIAAILILLLLFVSYRKFSDLLWVFVSVAFGWVFALGTIAAVHDSISIIIVGIASIIIGIAVNYPLHFMDILKEGKPVREVLKEMVNPLLIGNVTTVAAFLCLLWLDAAAMRDFGLFGGLMLIGTILFVLIFLPQFAKTHEPTAMRVNFGEILPERSVRNPWLLLAVVILTAVFAWFSRGISFDADMNHINYMTAAQKRDMAALSTALEGSPERTPEYFAVAQGVDLESALEANDALLAALTQTAAPAWTGVLPKTLSDSVLQKSNCVKCSNLISVSNRSSEGYQKRSIRGPGNLLPSRAEQERRLARWARFKAEHPEILSDLREEAAAEGFAPGAFTPFEELLTEDFKVQPAGFFAPVIKAFDGTAILGLGVHDDRGSERSDRTASADPGYIRGSAPNDATVGSPADRGSDRSDRTASAVPGYIRGSAPNDATEGALADRKVSIVNKVLSSERPVAPAGRDDILIFTGKDVSGGLVSLLSDSFDYIGTVCSLVVFIFLLLSFRRIETALLAFLPLAVSWIWILGSMDLLGVSFNIVNIILATFIFGQGDDYTIFITEGLMYEYAYRRKRMASYKNSVLVSALIMFIGIGALIVAKHPAMRSLAVVTIIGMLMVVAMAYYLPPLVFRWLTSKGGRDREYPITLGRIFRSLFALLFIVFYMWLWLYPYTFFYFLFGKGEERKLRYHKTFQRLAAWICRHIPGVSFSCSNPGGEDFGKPGVVICNHQSHLDLICLMMLSPKLVFVTNHWVWHNPIYGYLLRKLEYFPAENGVGEHIEAFREYIRRGYSIVIFPEGTRTPDGKIGRFHQGAFMLARELGVDIVPVFVHGAYDVLPKHDFMLRRGVIYCEVGQRVPVGSGAEGVRPSGSPSAQQAVNAPAGLISLTVAKAFRQYYIREYARIRREQETPQYWSWFVRAKYMYKGADIEAECRRELRAAIADGNPAPNNGNIPGTAASEFGAPEAGTATVRFENCGIGVRPLLYALCHPDARVLASDPDPDNIALLEGILQSFNSGAPSISGNCL